MIFFTLACVFIVLVILGLVYFADNSNKKSNKTNKEYDYSRDNKFENDNNSEQGSKGYNATESKSEETTSDYKEYLLEKIEIINVNCNVCSLNFSTLADKKYYVFYCPRCKTIYEYEKTSKIRNIKVVRKGKVIPQEYKKEISILGLKDGVINQEILNLAWRKKLELYHPDKVAHLAPEIQSLAEEKTKELNEAYGRIKTWIIENNYLY